MCKKKYKADHSGRLLPICSGKIRVGRVKCVCDGKILGRPFRTAISPAAYTHKLLEWGRVRRERQTRGRPFETYNK